MREMLIYLGFGSNQGNRVQNINRAINMLTSEDQVTLCGVSNFYDNPPIGNLPQPNYINAVVSFRTKLTPIKLLKQIQSIEYRLGRSKVRKRWDSRTIDIDILIYDHITINSKNLTIPHPEIKNRPFVMLPLSELEENIFIPGQGKLSALINLVALDKCKRISTTQK